MSLSTTTKSSSRRQRNNNNNNNNNNCSQKNRFTPLWSSEMAQIERSELYYLTITPTDAPKSSDLWQKPAMEDQRDPTFVVSLQGSTRASSSLPVPPRSSFCRKQELLTTVNMKPTVTEPHP
jgi:hypothetical protein